MPAGFTRYLEYIDDDETDVIMPTKLDDVHLARNVIADPPAIDHHLLQVYDIAKVSTMDIPEMSNHPKTIILSTSLVPGLRRSWNQEATRKWDEWTPMDRQMQRLMWTMVRYSMWDGLSFVPKYIMEDDNDDRWWGLDVNPAWEELEQLSSTIPMPAEPDYYVLTGTNKILI